MDGSFANMDTLQTLKTSQRRHMRWMSRYKNDNGRRREVSKSNNMVQPEKIVNFILGELIATQGIDQL